MSEYLLQDPGNCPVTVLQVHSPDPINSSLQPSVKLGLTSEAKYRWRGEASYTLALHGIRDPVCPATYWPSPTIHLRRYSSLARESHRSAPITDAPAENLVRMYRQGGGLEPGMSTAQLSISSPGPEDYVTYSLLPIYPPKPVEPLPQGLEGSGCLVPFLLEWAGAILLKDMAVRGPQFRIPQGPQFFHHDEDNVL